MQALPGSATHNDYDASMVEGQLIFAFYCHAIEMSVNKSMGLVGFLLLCVFSHSGNGGRLCKSEIYFLTLQKAFSF